MFMIRDLIIICIIFMIVLILFLLLRPLFILKRDPLTGRPVDDVDVTKLFGWSILITFILSLVYYLLMRCNCEYRAEVFY